MHLPCLFSIASRGIFIYLEVEAYRRIVAHIIAVLVYESRFAQYRIATRTQYLNCISLIIPSMILFAIGRKTLRIRFQDSLSIILLVLLP